MHIEDKIFAEHWLTDYSGGRGVQVPVIFCDTSTRPEGTKAVRFVKGRTIKHGLSIPFDRFLTALRTVTDIRDLETDFPRQGGFELDASRQKLADTLHKGIWFVFNNEVLQGQDLGVRTVQTVLPEHRYILGGFMVFPTDIPVTMVPAYPKAERLARMSLVYASR